MSVLDETKPYVHVPGVNHLSKPPSPHQATKVSKLHASNSFGAGIKIGIIDGGVDYTHSALGGHFSPGHKVAFGYNFVGNDFTGFNNPVPSDDPIDTCNGQGTRVAGIIAGKQNPFYGVAPDATLGAYRVSGCVGTTAIGDYCYANSC
ncbi:peptidase S8/S53 domain-containing protein [Syncephalis fuscata]|nr:peptidase S8/S53 domain-containing protein [Syncephalis fuscata]